MFTNHPHSEGPLGKYRSALWNTPVFFDPDPPEKKDEPKDEPPKADPPEKKTFTEDQVNDIVKGRVGETKRKALEDLAADLGVSIEEAKEIVKAHNDRVDSEKTEAQKAREKADRDAAEAETETSKSKQATHDAAVERVLLRSAPAELVGADDDKPLDAWLQMRRKLVDVEIGADADTIRKAVEKLKTDEPLLFSGGAGKRVPPTDPKARPPRPTGQESAYERGAARAKALMGEGKSTHPFLDGD